MAYDANGTHAVVRTDNLTGITDGAKLATAKYYVTTTPTAVDNGRIVKLDSYLADEPERETWKAVTPTSGDTVEACHGKLGLVATPEMAYEKKYFNLEKFYNAANERVRVYLLEPGDEFSVTQAAFTANGYPTDSKKIVTLTASTQMTAVASVTSGTDYFADYIKTETVGGVTYYVLRVL